MSQLLPGGTAVGASRLLNSMMCNLLRIQPSSRSCTRACKLQSRHDHPLCRPCAGSHTMGNSRGRIPWVGIATLWWSLNTSCFAFPTTCLWQQQLLFCALASQVCLCFSFSKHLLETFKRWSAMCCASFFAENGAYSTSHQSAKLHT